MEHTDRIRVYEIARRVGIPSAELVVRLRNDGLEVKNHMSTLTPTEAERVEASLRSGHRTARPPQRKEASADRRHGPSPEEGRGGVVVRRRSARRTSEGAAEQERPAPTEPGRTPAPKSPPGASVSPRREATRGRSPTERAVAAAVREEGADPRTRFERELAAARARTEARQGTAEPERPSSPAAGANGAAHESAVDTPPAGSAGAPDRPRVGDVIELPRRRIRVVERTERPPRRRGRPQKKQKLRRPAQRTEITTPAAHKRVVQIEDAIDLASLAQKMGVKANEVLKAAWGLGITGVNLNSTLDAEAAELLAERFEHRIENIAFREEEALEVPTGGAEEVPRSPVVTVMGHVDHGKTSLLDTIRNTRVAAGEAGGITQDIAAYPVGVDGAGELVFLDTPGHEAFSAMRARGAQVTDVVILVVAANDGVMPQTIEAIDHASAAGVPIVVAINKIDLPEAQPDRVRSELAEHGLVPEAWGGDVQMVEISARTGEGVADLLEAVALQAEVLELTARADGPAVAAVIEAALDKTRGPVATVLVTEGTLSVGDVVVAGEATGRVRALIDHQGARVGAAGPATPVEVLGLDAVPLAGDTLNAVDEETARRVADHRREHRRKRELAVAPKRTVRDVIASLGAGERPDLAVVLKAKVAGSAEALRAALERQATDRVGVNVIGASVGGITESDVHLASASNAVIIGFQVRPLGKAETVARQRGVPIHTFDVIYEAVDEVRSAMAGLLPPVKSERQLGKADVRELFQIPRVGTVAGCYVTSGRIPRGARARIVRAGVVSHDSSIASLRRFNADVAEVAEGYECGLVIEGGGQQLERGDTIEAYEVIETAATL